VEAGEAPSLFHSGFILRLAEARCLHRLAQIQDLTGKGEGKFLLGGGGVLTLKEKYVPSFSWVCGGRN